VVVDQLLRHLDGVGVGVLLGIEHPVGRDLHVKSSALDDSHRRLGTPTSAVRLARLWLDLPPFVLSLARRAEDRSLSHGLPERGDGGVGLRDMPLNIITARLADAVDSRLWTIGVHHLSLSF